MEPVAVEFRLRGPDAKVVYEMGTSLDAVLEDAENYLFRKDEVASYREIPLAHVIPKFRKETIDCAYRTLAAAGVKERVFYLGMPI